jgi:RND family efflux transporter MFP subunit
MQRKTFLIAIGALAAGALAGAGVLLAQTPARPAAAPASANAGTGAAATVEYRTVTDRYAADAVIEAVRQATVSAQIAGTITRLHADAGDRVKRGQLLAEIDTRETDAQLAAGRASVAQAEAALARARLDYERTASLVKQNFVSRSALDNAEADYKAAQAALDVARAGVASAQTSRTFAEVRAPLDGVVSRRLVESGDLAMPGKPLFDVHDPAALRAVGAVPQFMLSQVTAARDALVQLPALGQAIPAVRVTVLPAADARLLSTQIRADLPADMPAAVVPGTAAKILVPVGTGKRLVMPAAAVVRRGELTATYVIGPDGRAQLRQIRVGEAAGDDGVEVLAGLSDGERVQLNPLAPR